MKIVQKLSVDWQRVAIFLGFDHSVLTTIEYDYPHMTEKACEEMFRRWLSGEAPNDYPKWTNILMMMRIVDIATLCIINNSRLYWLSITFN